MIRASSKKCMLLFLTVLVSLSFCTSTQAQGKPILSGKEMLRPGNSDKPTEVSVAIWLVDIDSINSSNQNFVANVFLMLTWEDPRLAHNDNTYRNYGLNEIWNPRIQIANEIGIVRHTLPEIAEVEPDGTVTYIQRYVGPFSQPLKLKEFPFDSQTFQLQFVSTGNTPEEVEFVRYKEWIDDGVSKAGGISDNISLPDWTIKSFDTVSEPYVISPSVINAGYAFKFLAKRDVRHYLWKVILPLMLIVMMSWSVFWIDPSNSATQIAVAMTSMLTLIAYRFAIDTQVPKVPYMTRLDLFTVAGTVLVFLSLIQVIITSRLFQTDKVDLSRKIDRASRLIFPLLFTIGLSFSLFG